MLSMKEFKQLCQRHHAVLKKNENTATQQKESDARGHRILITSKRPRFSKSFLDKGYKQHLHTDYYIIVDVTSASAQKEDRVFSPLLHNFMEGMWQRSKRYNSNEISNELEDQFWNQVFSKKTTAKCPRRSALVQKFKNKHGMNPREVGYRLKDYNTADKRKARKNIYTKLYLNHVIMGQARERVKILKHLLQVAPVGLTVVVKDYDGAKKKVDGCTVNMVEKVDENLLEEKANDLQHSFGHGYVAAGVLAGFRTIFDHVVDV